MKTQSIFKFLFACFFTGALMLTSCESNDNTKDSNSETTEGDVNDPTKYNSGSNTSTRTGGSMGLNKQGETEESNLMSENQGAETRNKQDVNHTTNQTSTTSGMNTSSGGTDLGGTSSSTQNITKNPEVKNKGVSGTTGGSGRASGMQH